MLKECINLLPHHLKRIREIDLIGSDNTDYRNYIISTQHLGLRSQKALEMFKNSDRGFILTLDPRKDYVCNGVCGSADVPCVGISNLDLYGCNKIPNKIKEIKIAAEMQLLPHKRYSYLQVFP